MPHGWGELRMHNNRLEIILNLKLNSDIINFEIQSIPRWVELINQRYNGFENHEILELHKLKRLD